MKKNCILWMFAMLMLAVGMSSCSSDNDEIESFDDNPSEDIYSNDSINSVIGTWQLLNYSGGFSGQNVDVNPGEITLTFTKDGIVKVLNKGKETFLFPTGTFNYYFRTIDRSIFTGEKDTALYIDGGNIHLLHFTYGEGMLYLAEECFDGFCYALRKIG